MAVDERRLAVADLRPGMFVSRLDREWLGTPFPIQGFHVEAQDDIDLVARYCRFVYIDVQAQAPGPRRALQTLEGSLVGGTPLRRVLPYQVRAGVREELPRAIAAQDEALRLAADIELDLKAGRSISPERLQAGIEPLVASVLRNPDSVFWLIGLVRRDRYLHGHALNCSALAAAFGRHLAMPRTMLVELAMGAFLLDVGMTSLPRELLEAPAPLARDEEAMVRGHVQAGLDILDTAGLASQTVREMLACHHERHDGSGYPHGLAGEAIPLAARLAGLVDSYDAMASARPHRPAQAPHAVLQLLYRERGRRYQEEVIEQFMQCLGVYPTGSLVELSNGEVAVVMAQNQARRLRPRVMVLLDSDKQRYPRFHDIDLMQMDEDASGRPAVVIAAALPSGAYGLDSAELFLE
jgi:HD-GYP domain-containing protein (c-di-GMP phosphodiesterase class II)